ncbi:MAG: DUF6273 domain-containing protein [Acutalibacteraceae bacterium]|nr:DUF6273 domain-containing protein [Acutalibacteraceae bacterium]
MQKSKSFKRLLAVVIAVAMVLTAIPFSVTAEEVTKDTIVFGGISWDVLTKEADGDLILVTTDVLAKAKFNTKAPMNFATSTLYTTLNTDFYATFSDAEKAAIVPTTITYDYWDATAKAKVTGATLSANVVVPDATMAASLGKANLAGTTTATQYFLASARAKDAKDAVVNVITKGGTASSASGTSKTASGYRAVITLKSGNYAQFPAVDGVTYTVNDKAVTYYATTSATSFKVVVDEANYAADELAVALGTEALTATNGVYTIPVGSAAELSLSGVKAQPADFTAYDAAVAQAKEVDADLFDTADLDAALAVDVSACTKLEQAKVDEAAAAILDAIANLKYKPADTAAYLKALAELRVVYANEPVQITETLTAKLYNLDAAANEIGDSFNIVIKKLLNNYEDRTNTPISGYTIDKQADVDAATAEIEDIIARVPLMRASTAAWSKALNDIKNLSPSRYSNAAELIAEANALAAENNYIALNLDITHQDEIDAATAELKAIYAKAEVISSDFSALDAAIEKANTYLAENFYTEEEMVGAGAAWEDFVKQLEAAKSLDRTLFTTYADHQGTIDNYTVALVKSMENLVPFERLTDMEEDFINPTKDFFTKIMDFFGMVSGLLVALAGLLPLVIVGELVLYDVFVMIGDEDLLAFVEKIGIKPPEEEPVEPAPEA